MDLANKTILITGAQGALGSAVADCACELGARLVLIDIHASRIHGEERWFEVDLNDRSAVKTAIDSIGHIDAVCHTVGGFDMGPATYDIPSAAWDAMFSVNVSTLQNLLSAVVPKMQAARGGSIVTVGALSALKGQPNMSAYCAAKSTVMRLTESLSAEVREQGINVNCVLPSIIDTPRNRADMPDADFSRWVAPRDLAQVICFLASDAARSLHGALIPVAGLC